MRAWLERVFKKRVEAPPAALVQDGPMLRFTPGTWEDFDAIGDWPEGYAYAYWSCKCSGNHCHICRPMQRLHFVAGPGKPPEDLRVYQSQGCFRTLVFVREDHEDARAVAEYIRSIGGEATRHQVRHFREQRAKEQPADGPA
jgi:hypothetical protein